MRTETGRLIIMACSASKAADPKPLPAYERYTGVAYRVMQRYVEARRSLPRLYILSAKHGLIGCMEPITSYNVRMNKTEAEWQRPENTRRLHAGLCPGIEHVFVFLGRDYRRAIDLAELEALPNCQVVQAQGGIGQMLHQFKEWLYEEETHG
jgi:hypothetical protein